MSTPEFVLELRKKIGHDLLWLNGVTGCVLNEHGQLLLGRRSDTGEWAMVYGINEPGEQPADTVVREIKEETGIDAIVTDLVAVTSSNKVLTYANGDNTMYMDHSFLCALKPGGCSILTSRTKSTATPTPCSSSMGSSTSGYKVSSL